MTRHAGTLDMYTASSVATSENLSVHFDACGLARVGLTDPARSILVYWFTYGRLRLVGGWRRDERRAASCVAEVRWRPTIRRETLLVAARRGLPLVGPQSLEVVYPHTFMPFQSLCP